MINNSILVENKADNLDDNNTTEKMYSLPSNGAEKMDTLDGNHTCGDGLFAVKGTEVKKPYSMGFSRDRLLSR
ncbi:MAG: hypothetical protein E7262_00480 [Lachnospiraceae bacterium]|nr:hypothetical protein [Lachnospiraceae bacterium]